MTVILPIFQSSFFTISPTGVATISICSTRVRVGEAVEGGGEDTDGEEGGEEFFHA